MSINFIINENDLYNSIIRTNIIFNDNLIFNL